MELVTGDIAQEATEAVVNAANNALWMGSGVAGALKRAGGEEIEQEALLRAPIPVGEAVVTGGYKLQAKYVIHAAAMGQDLIPTAKTIRAATAASMRRAAEIAVSSVCFPVLGSGVGGFPMKDALEEMLHAIEDELRLGTTVRLIRFCVLPSVESTASEVLAGIISEA